MRRISAVVAAVVFALVGAMHAVWAFSPWPMATWEQFAFTILGAPDGKVPPGLAPMSIGVALACFASAYFLLARVGLAPGVGPRWLGTVGVWTAAVVMLGRATAAGFVPSALHLVDSPEVYERLDLAVYSPICLVLGVLAVIVARSPKRA